MQNSKEAQAWVIPLMIPLLRASLDASGTLNTVTGQPTGISILCLSRHDGTDGVDAQGGASGPQWGCFRDGRNKDHDDNGSDECWN